MTSSYYYKASWCRYGYYISPTILLLTHPGVVTREFKTTDKTNKFIRCICKLSYFNLPISLSCSILTLKRYRWSFASSLKSRSPASVTLLLYTTTKTATPNRPTHLICKDIQIIEESNNNNNYWALFWAGLGMVEWWAHCHTGATWSDKYNAFVATKAGSILETGAFISILRSKTFWYSFNIFQYHLRI